MAIAFPRTLPDAFKVVGLSFPPAPMIEVTPLRSGRQISHNLGPTLWRPKYDSADLNPARAGEVRALYDTLLSEREFYGFDHSRAYPLAYRRTHWTGLTVGGSPFTGVADLSAVAGSNVEVTLINLPIGFVLSHGDYIAFDYSTSLRALHRVSAPATANGSGQMTVEVRPPIRPGWSAGADVSLYRPAARMIILPGTYSEKVDLVTRLTSISFEAIQSL